MQFFRRTPATPDRLGIFPGTFNPPTLAHLALARTALGKVCEVVFVLPREFPHKPHSGASFDQRIELLQMAVADEPAFSIAATDGGLFIEIAGECRAAYGDGTRLTFICGRDAAERITGWDYGRPEAFAEMLRVFDLLVASRSGEYQPPGHSAARVDILALPQALDHVSATEVRERIARGERWQHLVPDSIVPRVAEIYARKTGELR